MPKYKVTFREVVTYEVEIDAPEMPDHESDWFARVQEQYPDDWEYYVSDVSCREFDGAVSVK